MARYTGPACRLCRRENEKLFLKGERCLSSKCSFERRAYAPGDLGIVEIGPAHRVHVILAGLDVGEGKLRTVGLRGSEGLPEEGHDLLPGAGLLGRELPLAGARGEIVLERPEHRLGEPGVVAHVDE